MDDVSNKEIVNITKRVLVPCRRKQGKDTELIEQFIDELAALHEKYSNAGLSQFDGAHVMLQLSMSTVMRYGPSWDAVRFMRYIRTSGDGALKSMNQHSSILFEVPEELT